MSYPDSDYKKIQLATVSLIVQLEEILNTLTLEEYSKPLPILSDCSISQHTRHIIEFFQCLFLMSDSGIVNYDSRERNKNIETSISYSLEAIEKIYDNLNKSRSDVTLSVEFSFGTEEETPVIKTASSLGRELAYNIEHCVHHMAIIKIGILSILPDFKFPEHFGIAASTVKYQKTISCAQ